LQYRFALRTDQTFKTPSAAGAIPEKAAIETNLEEPSNVTQKTLAVYVPKWHPVLPGRVHHEVRLRDRLSKQYQVIRDNTLEFRIIDFTIR
jgi:hypothetical protein